MFVLRRTSWSWVVSHHQRRHSLADRAVLVLYRSFLLLPTSCWCEGSDVCFPLTLMAWLSRTVYGGTPLRSSAALRCRLWYGGIAVLLHFGVRGRHRAPLSASAGPLPQLPCQGGQVGLEPRVHSVHPPSGKSSLLPHQRVRLTGFTCDGAASRWHSLGPPQVHSLRPGVRPQHLPRVCG